MTDNDHRADHTRDAADAAHPDGRRRWRTARLTLAGIIALAGCVAFYLSIGTDRVDTALFFVLLPAALAIVLVFAHPRSGYGQVFAGVTIVMLLSSIVLHEGVVCVVLAAPLIYAVAIGTVAVVRAVRDSGRRGHALLPIPLLVLATGLEGVTPQLRVDPEQSVSVTRTVALPAAEVAARVAGGPRPAATRSVPLRLLGVPMPQHIAGRGLDPGDTWVLGYHDTSHGAGGAITTRVAERADGRLRFDVVRNDSITSRWMDLTGAELTWRAVDDTHTEVRIALDYTRGLDPSWYFGPLQDRLTMAGAGHLLDMLRLS